MRPIAPNAFLRPCQSRARSAGSVATRTARAPASRQSAATRVDVVVESGRGAIELDEQDRRGVGRIAGGVDRRFHRPDRRGIDHLERRGNDARRDDRRHRMRRASIDMKSASSVRTACGFFVEPHRDVERDAEASLRSDERADEVVALRARRRGLPSVHDLAARAAAP